jgi:hypothetical protein
MKNRIQTPVPTLHQCITEMEEYNTKSLEELRFEDYQLKRKFQNGFVSTLFGSIFESTREC